MSGGRSASIDAMTLGLRALGTLCIEISGQTRVDGVPAGGRLIGEAASCDFTGDGPAAGVHAAMAGTSSDWLTLHPDGSVTVDARLLLRTDTGAALAITYRGRAAGLPAAGAPVYAMLAFETDDPGLRWLNAVPAVAKGVRHESSLVYEIHRLH